MTNDSRGKRLRTDRHTGSLPGAVSDEEQALAELMRNPADWGEAILSNRDGSARRYRPYQREDLECTAARIAHMDGRAVGKTIDLSTLVLWYAFVHAGSSVLVAAPYQGQLDTIIEEIDFQIGRSDILRSSVARNAKGHLKIKRKPYFQLEFTNGTQVYTRPASTGAASSRSLHVQFLLIDEAAWLPEESWNALRQCLNAGGKMRVYSTPNGLRDRAYYRVTQSKEWHQFHWPSWVAPDWSPEREHELIDFYGGKDTPGWQHEVAGEHGKPTYGAFNPVHVLAALAEIPKYRKVVITGEALTDCRDEGAIRDRLQDVLQLDGVPDTYWVGGDLGYTSDPTELLVFREELATETLTLVLRIHAEQVAYPVISEIIALIDRVYAPVGIGVDRGGNGLSVVQELMTLDKFRERYFTGRLVGYDFGGSIAVGEDDAGRPLKRRNKEHMTALISKALNAGHLVLPKQDHEVEDQLCSQTYILTNHAVVYSKGNDHIIDAMRCALLRRAQERTDGYERVEIVGSFIPVLTDPIFEY
jgi:hypothetical protein